MYKILKLFRCIIFPPNFLFLIREKMRKKTKISGLFAKFSLKGRADQVKADELSKKLEQVLSKVTIVKEIQSTPFLL